MDNLRGNVQRFGLRPPTMAQFRVSPPELIFTDSFE